MADEGEKSPESGKAAEPRPERPDDEPVAVVAPLRRRIRARDPVAVEPPDGGAPDAA